MAGYFPPQHAGQSGQSSHGQQAYAKRYSRTELNRLHNMGHLWGEFHLRTMRPGDVTSGSIQISNLKSHRLLPTV